MALLVFLMRAVRAVGDQSDLDQDNSDFRGERETHTRDGRPARPVSRRVQDSGFPDGWGPVRNRFFAHANPRSAVSRIRYFRRADVSRLASYSAPARDDHDRRVGDESVSLLNRVPRRVSASRDFGR